MRRIVKGIIGILLFIVVVVIAFGAFGLFKKYSPAKDMADLNAYFYISGEDQAGLTVNNTVLAQTAIKRDGKVFVDFDTVVSYLNDRFYHDSNENFVLYTLPEETIFAEEGTQYINEGGRAYLALDFVAEHTDMDYSVLEDPARVVIRTDFSERMEANIKKDTDLRVKGGVKSPILTEVKKGQKVTVLEEGDPFTKVATEDGFVGYVKDNTIGEKEPVVTSRSFAEPEYTSIHMAGTVAIGWHQVAGSAANAYLDDALAPTKGLTVVAPTWFFLTDTNGSIVSLADADYVANAHQKGLSVWAVLNDFDGEAYYGGINSTDETYELLSCTSKRMYLIQQVVSEVLNVGADGINVDIEKVSEECGPHYVQFIRELSLECRKYGLVLSVDTYVPSDWSLYYNRKEQGIVADYVVIMAYDEYGPWSSESGPNSSVPYVADAIRDTLKVVPKEKMIIGLPFYTKFWEETPVAGTNTYESTCTVMTMQESLQFIANRGLGTSFDEATGMNLASYEENGLYYRMWVEDASSLSAKLQLMKENGIAGCAFWKLTQEDPAVWDTIAPYLQN